MMAVSARADTPAVTCTGISEQAQGNTYTFTAAASTQKGASISSYKFNYGDNQSYEIGAPKADPGTATVKHTYAGPGSYPVTVTVSATDNGGTVTSSCKKQVTIAKADGDNLAGTGSSNLTALVAAGAGVAAFVLAYRRQRRKA